MPKRRPTPEISLSFLDVICCGFGAVILLLMITKTVEPQVLEESTFVAEGRVAKLTEQLFEIRGETTILNRDLAAKQEQISEFEEQVAILRGALAASKSRYDALQTTRNANSIEKAELAIARQELSEEEERLLGLEAAKINNFIGGIPIDSEYIIFVIDSSPSMKRESWARVLAEFETTLNVYPAVKGIQVLNDGGEYLLSSSRGEWLVDTPERRRNIINNLRYWSRFGPSSPERGINRALRDFYDRKKKISIFIYGDDFLGGGVSRVMKAVEVINRNNQGERLVRIHAIGFPNILMIGGINASHVADFATLMRDLTYENGGSFVGLNDYRP